MSTRAVVWIVALVAFICAIVGMRREPGGDRAGEPAVRVAGTTPSSPSRGTAPAVRSEVVSTTAPVPVRIAAQPVAPPPPIAPDAAASLALTLQGGDARSPPIAPRDVDDDEAPTTNELADPAAYRRYESRRQARVYRAFEREASGALVQMRRDIDRARTAGVPAEQIAEGEEKAQRLAETLRRLRDGEIGANE
jgi:hypothetical protein